MSQRSQLLDLWEIDHEPRLNAIRDAAMALLQAIEDQREHTYGADTVKEIDDYATDVAGTTSNLLNDLHGRYLKEADEIGLHRDMLPFEDGGLMDEFEKFKARSDARRPLSVAAE